MRKFLLTVATFVLAAAMATPASAVVFKLTGSYRFRGATADDLDRNSRNHDSKQFSVHRFRPRFHAIAEGGKLWAIWETDIANGDRTFGRQGRANTRGNRFLVDFAIPATKFRFRFGRTDWKTGDGEFASGSGSSRRDGYGLYGKLFGPVSLSFFNIRLEESGPDSPNRSTGEKADDADIYYLGLKWKVNPKLTTGAYVIWDHNKAERLNGNLNIFWYALHANAKIGNASIRVFGIVEDGEAQFSRAGGLADLDIEAWMVAVRAWLTFGKFKLGFYFTGTSGDDDTTDTTFNSGLFGRQPDNKLKRFSQPNNNSFGRILGPSFLTRRRHHSLNPRAPFQSEALTGDGGVKGNGMLVYELLGQYQATKKMKLLGGVSIVRTHSKRADIDVCNDGNTTSTQSQNAGNTSGRTTQGDNACGFLNAGPDATYDSAKDFGTIVETSIRYKLYKTLELRSTFQYLFAGDYGKQVTEGGVAVNARDFDDAWMLIFQMHYKF